MPRYAAVCALLSVGCAQAVNYTEARAPRFAEDFAPAGESEAFDGELDVVTLNIKFARRVDRAAELFDQVAALRRADVVCLQEMDQPGTRALAAHLQMAYVYYPATVHPKTSRDFGNAVLSRWPILRDWKVRLPHAGFFDGSQRTATCASVQVPVERVDVCSLHFATQVELLPGDRRDQARAVVESLGAIPARVVVAGDLNSHALGSVFSREAFDWPTKGIGATRSLFSIDHIFTRGFAVERVGKVEDTRGATDHAAVWAKLVWR
ncbi:MAG TPA: endonuclease/exonuclease/phosphatase family protein [Polyangiaceae bacterium]|nr:endonuclease/exonuclease/phosphatase family protein [Polyangiaceae bacterium]